MKQNDPNQNTIFDWDYNDFEDLYNSCDKDDAIKISLEFITNKNSIILEAGCGTGRVVKYLYDKGYKNIEGIELNHEVVSESNKRFPYLNISNGNILQMPYPNNYFDIVLCYGVIEHFFAGTEAALLSLNRVLKKDGIAIISVPSFNTLRKISKSLSFINPKKQIFFRKIFKKDISQINVKGKNQAKFEVFPTFGQFFEYRLTRNEFESECQKAGFEIIRSLPIYHVDGLYHSFGNIFCKYENWSFRLNHLGSFVNNLLIKVPFLSNHMHLCVLKKTDK